MEDEVLPDLGGYEKTKEYQEKNLVALLYATIPDMAEKFLLMAHVECDYSQEEVARMMGVSQTWVCRHAESLLKRLKASHKLKEKWGMIKGV